MKAVISESLNLNNQVPIILLKAVPQLRYYIYFKMQVHAVVTKVYTILLERMHHDELCIMTESA